MHEKITRINELRADLLSGTHPEAIEARHRAGRLTARERIEKLFDAGTFYEIDFFAKPVETGFAKDKESTRGGGVIVGYGDVNGRPVCAWAQDALEFGGRVGVVHARKIVEVIERAVKARIPCVGMVDSEGLLLEDMISTPSNYSYDRIMCEQTAASGVIPQLSLIMGPCKGAAAISAQLSDFVFMVRDSSYACVAKPADGMTMEERGAATTHFRKTGCCDVLAKNDEECIRKARELLALLPSNNGQTPPPVDNGDDINREVPELLDIVPGDIRKPYKIQKVIHAIADDGQFFETRGGWADNLVVGFARFGGKVAGLIANNPRVLGGCLDVNSADKHARFVRFCDAFSIPLVYLADTPAFLPAVKQERRAIIRHGAKVVFSNSMATTPQMQVYLRKSYGGGNLAMPGSNLGGDVGLLWPTAEVLLMHAEGAVSIIYRKEISEADDPAQEYKDRVAQFKEMGAVENEWEGWSGQDYIHPKETRSKIIKTLRLLEGKTVETNFRKHDNMPL
jgi:acetyl-CoA carboxylase carboxyltransferase component